MVTVFEKGDLRVGAKRRDKLQRVRPGNIGIGHALYDTHWTMHANRASEQKMTSAILYQRPGDGIWLGIVERGTQPFASLQNLPLYIDIEPAPQERFGKIDRRSDQQ